MHLRLEEQLTYDLDVMCLPCVHIICRLGVLINKVNKEPFYENLVIKIITSIY